MAIFAATVIGLLLTLLAGVWLAAWLRDAWRARPPRHRIQVEHVLEQVTRRVRRG